MVCIIELIKKLKNDLLCRINLDLALYNYCNNKSIVQLPYNNNLALTIAFRGYNKEIEKNFNIDTIDSHQKQNNFKDKFAQCIGIRLFTCAEETILLEDFERFDLKQITGSGKYVIEGDIKNKKEQANNFVIDITKSKIEMEEVERQVKSIYNSKRYLWVDKIIIVKGNKILKIYKRK